MTRSGCSVNKWDWNYLDIIMGQSNFMDWFADPSLFDEMEMGTGDASEEKEEDPE